MSWLNPVPRAELGTKYTHYGRFLGLVPCYVGSPDGLEPQVAERNWVPAWWFWLVMSLFELSCIFSSWMDPEFEPHFSMVITGRINP